MAKSKHQILAVKIREILSGVDEILAQSRIFAEVVQFHFYEKIIPLGMPLPSKEYLQGQFKTHAVSMLILSPSQKLRSDCHSHLTQVAYPPLSPITRKLCSKGPPNLPLATWWGVKTKLPADMKPILDKGYWETLLYCPDKTEVSSEIDWFEKEDYINSFSFQFESAYKAMERENIGKTIIRKNLSQLALPYFRSIVDKWKDDPEGHDTISQNPGIVFQKPFAPENNDNLAHAYEKVRRILRERSLRNYEHLMILWRNHLESLIFYSVNWNREEQENFIKEWETNIFGSSQATPQSHEGRWEQSKSVSRESAGKIIRYFLDRFLSDPLKKKRDGEVACLLWTLIWFSQDPETTNITLSQILKLQTINIDKDYPAIIFDSKEIEISFGLYQLLQIFQGKGEGKRPRRLFSLLSADYLQQAVKDASIALFGSRITPISPAAFLSFPHPKDGKRFSKKQRTYLQSIDPGSVAGNLRRQILSSLRKGLAENPPTTS